MSWVDSGYFGTIRQPLLAGRGFAETDRAGSPGVVVVNEELARAWWPTAAVSVGHEIKLGGPYMEGPTLRIVGVVRDVSQMGMDEKPLPEIYFPFSQRASRGMVVMIRTTADPALLTAAVRKEMSRLDHNLPIQSLRPFEEWMGATLVRRRFSTALLSAFAGLAMLLAGVGIYGVLNYWVSVRQKEIAVRMALGASRSGIVRWGAAHALRLAGAGVVLGGAGAWMASKYLANISGSVTAGPTMVFGVSPQDPAMLLAAGVAVLGIAALAAVAPLWRAMRVDAASNLKDA
jgi:putative ABC transport system permease protein